MGPRTTILLLCLSTLWLTSCSRSEPLDYETAMSLMRERNVNPVKITFSASPKLAEQEPRIKQSYDLLVKEHVLTCQTNDVVGVICEPGPAGDALAQEGSSNLALVAGRWTPSVIIRINRTGRDGAEAEVRMTFEPSELYKEYRDAFDTIQNAAESQINMTEQHDGKTAQVKFTHTEEGWHLDSMT